MKDVRNLNQEGSPVPSLPLCGPAVYHAQKSNWTGNIDKKWRYIEGQCAI